jgi:alanyl-tRNA synthetase
VPVLVREMGQAYPELLRAEPLITETLKLEERRFRKTLERGLTILDEETKALGRGARLKGDVAFTLYDTYGFPLDLTQDALRPRGIDVDVAAFNAAMEKQKEQARASWAGSGESKAESYWFPLREKYGATEFLGYDTEVSEGVVQTIIRGGSEVTALRPGESGEVILNQTPFYAESGGQVGDTGWIRRGSDGVLVAQVLATHKQAGDLFVHNVEVETHGLQVGDSVRLDVDHDRRDKVRRNHSATHLLHEALRQVLGDHVAQKGSLVAPDRLRFDFSHPKPMDDQEVAKVEDLANAQVLRNTEVTTHIMATDEAMESGARALFGEKYGDEVRVVAMGEADLPRANALGWSVELCGGTHVRRTGDIGLVSVVSESGVASGVRRIEALTGRDARLHADHLINIAKAAAAELKSPIDDMPARLTSLLEERRRLERELAETKKKLAMGGGAAGTESNIVDLNGTKFLRLMVNGLANTELKSLADEGKAKLGSGVVAVANTAPDGKGGLVVGVTTDLTDRFNAVELVRKGAEALGGKGGGGRPDMAQAGGPDGSKAEAALEAIAAAIGG